MFDPLSLFCFTGSQLGLGSLGRPLRRRLGCHFDIDFEDFLLLEDGFDIVLEDGLDVPCAAPSGGGGFAHTAAERVFLVVERVATGILVV